MQPQVSQHAPACLRTSRLTSWRSCIAGQPATHATTPASLCSCQPPSDCCLGWHSLQVGLSQAVNHAVGLVIVQLCKPECGTCSRK